MNLLKRRLDMTLVIERTLSDLAAESLEWPGIGDGGTLKVKKDSGLAAAAREHAYR
jgi:hypothetical protein